MDKTILVVEDNEDISLLLSLVLESVGYRVKAVDNGKDALNAVAQCKPLLILMDIMMPEVSGLEIAQTIKSQPTNHCLPILLVSAVDHLKQEEFVASKADGIIYKPFDLDHLISKVQELTASLYIAES